jgi:hypothetical protein
LLKIPSVYLMDKQAFRKEGGMLRLIGKPLDVAKELKAAGCTLIHIVDMDAISGLPKNLDVYDGLTYIINVQVECAPEPSLVMKLLSLKCRVVLPPSADVSALKEKKLLAAKIPKGYAGDAEGFHDVMLEEAGEEEVRRFVALGKRVIVYESGYGRLDAGCRKLVWGVISSS